MFNIRATQCTVPDIGRFQRQLQICLSPSHVATIIHQSGHAVNSGLALYLRKERAYISCLQ